MHEVLVEAGSARGGLLLAKEKKSPKEMVGDSLRELGELFFVFGIIEGVVGWHALSDLGLSLPVYAGCVAFATVVPYSVGMALELKRKS